MRSYSIAHASERRVVRERGRVSEAKHSRVVRLHVSRGGWRHRVLILPSHPSAVQSLLRGWLVSRVEKGRSSRARLSSTATTIGSNVTPRFSTVVPLAKAWWGGRRSRDYDSRERGRSASGDIVSALDTPLWGLAKWTSSSRIHSGDFYRSSPASIRIFRERSRLSWVANWSCVSMNRRQAIVSDGSMLAIDSVGDGLVTSILAIVDLRSTR